MPTRAETAHTREAAVSTPAEALLTPAVAVRANLRPEAAAFDLLNSIFWQGAIALPDLIALIPVVALPDWILLSPEVASPDLIALIPEAALPGRLGLIREVALQELI